MKKLTFLFFLVFLGTSSIAQISEFKIHSNGLIYNKRTVEKLHHIVDSLNVKFVSCDLTRDYNSKYQTIGNSVLIKGQKSSKNAINQLKQGISWDEFVRKFSPKIDTGLLIVKYEYQNYNDDLIVDYSSIQLADDFDYEISFRKDEENSHLNGNWVFAKIRNKSLRAFYLPNRLESDILPFRFSRLVQYSNCMIDTTSSVIYDDANRDYMWEQEAGVHTTNFMRYANNLNRRNQYLANYSDTTQAYWDDYEKWDSLKFDLIDLKLPDDEFQNLLTKAAEEAIQEKYSFNEFEGYVERYLSREIALELKRNRRVIGSCSMDSSPREHIKEIALLSAVTAKWEVFLKSHLDIMNDNVNRVSDGSWAWEQRDTYIKELEVLEINVIDLLLGISLRIENPSKNHYYGSISRVGRALSEYSNKEELEKVALELIGAEDLDNFNRLLTYYLLVNYRNNLKEEQDIKRVDKTLEIAKNELPRFIGSRL